MKSKKKKILLAVLVVAVIAGVVFGIPYIRRHFQPVEVSVDSSTKIGAVDMKEKKVLTVYFTRVGNTNFEEGIDAVSSASLMSENGKLIGNSELLATMVQKATASEVYAIRTVKKYPSSYTETTGVAKDEFDNNEKVELEGEMPDVSAYSDVVLVFPIWWWKDPMAVKSFLEKVDLSGKNLHLIVTHGGSGAGDCLEDTKSATKATVDENVLTVYDDEVTEAVGPVGEWLKQILK